MSFVTHLECALCGRKHEAGRIHNLCVDCHKPLWVRYDLDAVKKSIEKSALLSRDQSLWRYRELLPYQKESSIVSLGETMTPVIRVDRLGEAMGCNNLFIKDESRLPTGSFKARGMAMAVTMAHELGIENVAVPTAGNAGGAMAAYAARAGMKSFVFMPHDTPIINQKECFVLGAKTWLVDGLIDDCGALVARGVEKYGWFNVSTLKEPYRIEGKKTMGLELAEQFNFRLPDVIMYPTGGGTGLIGMWKAFDELEKLGWLESERKPRMYACQSDTCSPIVKAFKEEERFATKFENAHTVASGLRVPVAVGDFMILDAVRASGGAAISAEENSLAGFMELANRTEGIAVCPETAACLGVLQQLLDNGAISKDETVVVFNTGCMQKYPEVINESLPTISKSIDASDFFAEALA